MSKQPPAPPSDDSIDETTPPDPRRRQFLAGVGVAAAAVGTGMGASVGTAQAAATHHGAGKPLSATELDKLLRDNIKNVVVIFGENRSFNNLFADFPGLEQPLAALKPEDYRQLDRDGKTVLSKLPEVHKGFVHKAQTVDGVSYPAGTQYIENMPNAPFALKAPDGSHLPLSVVTRDLWHVFYQNQMQINGGKNDMFAAWADSGGLTMGHYGSSYHNLRLWDVAQEFTLCDNFFQGAFGGSYLNHQYLISAAVPTYPDADKSIAQSQIAETVSGAPDDPRLKPKPESPASALQGVPKFGPSALTPTETLGNGQRVSYSVNTMLPPYMPTPLPVNSSGVVDFSLPQNAMVMPPQSHHHIGDKLDQRGIEWAWYAGAFQQTLDSHGANISEGTPEIPNFQYHHQPFNYFKNLAPGTAARSKRLRDGGLGDDESTNKFLADAKAGKLPAVAFYKPQGNLNMHAGYADVASGDRHIAHAIKLLRSSPQWKNMVVIVTVDENGGWWDHVAPPKGDRWGPGTRIPALVVSPFARKGHVDHTVQDTASILRLITRVFQLEPLDGFSSRDKAMIARGQKPMGDLTNALQFTA